MSSRFVKWSLPALAFAVVVALAGVRTHAADEGAGAAAKGKITGTVHNEDGTVAANVNVRVLPSAAKPADKEPKPQAADETPAKPGKPAEGVKPERPKPVAEGKTDASGKFEIEVPAGKYQVVAMMRGQGRTQKTVEVKAGETKDLGTLTLKKGAAKKEAAPTT